MINPQWLELPISRTKFHGPKDVRVTEIRLLHCFLLTSQAKNLIIEVCFVILVYPCLFCFVMNPFHLLLQRFWIR